MVSLEPRKRPWRVKQIPVGSKFGEWTTISEVECRLLGSGNRRRGFVKVKCSCGTEDERLTQVLLAGRSKSCGSCKYTSGAEHFNWKGENAGYEAKHTRVKNLKGKAASCVWGCEAELYDWACVMGDYDNPDDYVAMCRLCHNRFDIEVKRFIMNTSTDELVRECLRQTVSGIRNTRMRERRRQDGVIGAP